MFTEIFRDNPLLMESRRSRLLVTKFRNWTPGVIAVAALLATCFGLLTFAAARYAEFVVPMFFPLVELFLVIIAVPSALHGVLAGEKEKRSLDMLLVAPLTEAQIVTAKTLRVVPPVAIIMILMTAVQATVLVVHGIKGMLVDDSVQLAALSTLASQLLVGGTAAFCSGVTMLVSSLSRSTASSMITSIGALFCVFVLVPILANALGSVSGGIGDQIRDMSPFVLTAQMFEGGAESREITAPIVAAAFATVFGLLLLAFAVRTLVQERKGKRALIA